LRSFGFAGTCFPITDGIEAASRNQTQAVRTDTEGVVEKPFMDWAQLGGLVEAGWEIGAHTASHGKVAEIYDAAGETGVAREAEAANTLFDRHLGGAPRHFAYPSGSRSPAIDAILARYYRSLRRWRFDWPICWTFTTRSTSPLAVDCQNIDLWVSFEDYCRIFEEATG